MINPHTCYIIGFVVSLLVYQLGWSEAYPALKVSLVSFLVVTIVAHLVLMFRWNKRSLNQDQKVGQSIEPKLNPLLVTVILYLCWLADFIHEGGIPLFKILLGISYDYKTFGVPSLHVFTVTFCSFYCIYLLLLFLKSNRRIYLYFYFINMASALLIYSRSMLFFNLASSFFLYVLYIKHIPYKKLWPIVPLVILLLYFFGVVGTFRVSFESKKKYDPSLFLDNGQATQQFRASSIPSEFFWPYIYISSPVANLQVNVNFYPVKPVNITRVMEYINNEWFFESLSKRINSIFGIERESEHTIKDPFNVSTVYSRSYSYLGWAGMIAMALLVLAIPLAYRKLIVNNPYQLVAVAILCTTYLFMTYDNTIRLMALGFQLVYPLFFPFVENKLSRFRFIG